MTSNPVFNGPGSRPQVRPSACASQRVLMVMIAAIAACLPSTAPGEDPRDTGIGIEKRRLDEDSVEKCSAGRTLPWEDADEPIPEPFAAGSCAVTLSHPLGGETLTAGTTERISWDAVDPVGDVVITVYRGESSYSRIGVVPLSDGSYAWEICPTFGNGSDYTLKIAAYSCGVYDTSAEFTIVGSAPRPTVTLTSPAGGETLTAGTVKTITWDTSDPYGSVNITLRRDGDHHSYVGYAPMADGRFDWTICPALGDATDYSVRLASYNCGPPVQDEGAHFEIVGSTPRPTITVTGPASDVPWIVGTTLGITWEATNPYGDVRIMLERAGATVSFLGLAPASDGGFDWPICPTIGDGTDYTVRVIAYECGPMIEDVSETFEITGSAPRPTVTLTSPVGWETLTAGTGYTIRWETTNPYGDVSVRLERNRAYYYQIASVPMADGRLDWFICPSIGDGADYSIRVVSSNCGPAVEDSTGLFEIAGSTPPPTLSLTWPVGGVLLAAGTSHRITWDATNPYGYVRIDLQGGGMGDLFLGYVPMSDRGFDWYICPAIGNATDYVIRLSSSPCGAQLEDFSGTFEIAGAAPRPTLVITSPTSGQVLTAGTPHTVTWDTTDPFGNLSIQLLKGEYPVAFLAGAVPMSDEHFTWNICPGIGDSDDYSIQLELSGCNITDTSATFEVADSSASPTFAITSPAGGERWTAGTTETILWETTAPFGYLNVSLFKNGFRHTSLGSAPMSSGGFDWEVDPLLYSGSDYQIELFAYECGFEADLSNPFELIGRSRADVNGDGYTDLADHAMVVDCLLGPGTPPLSHCNDEDMNEDGRVDLLDWATLQHGFTDSR